MSQLDALRAAGFSDDEVSAYGTKQRQTLGAAGFSDDEINAHLGAPPRPAPNMATGNKTFSRVLGDALSATASAAKEVAGGAAKTLGDIGSVYAPIEAALNAGTGLLFGFPAYVGAGLGGLVSKHLLGLQADPQELADTMSKVFTYQPMTQRGQRLAGNVMLPLTLLNEGAEATGYGATNLAMKAGASDNTAAVLGAVTMATIQMLAPLLIGELGRKMGGQTIDHADMRNVAKVVAGEGATPATVTAVEASLRSSYDKTGIGPFTIADAAAKDPVLKADLLDPAVDVPKALEPFVEKSAEAGPAPLARLTGTDLVGKSYEELYAMSVQAKEHNKALDITGIQRFFSADKAKEAEGWSARKRESWLTKNETDATSAWLQDRYINDELIDEHRKAVNDFDTESPETLGRSIALRARNIDEPGFFTTPDGTTVTNALRYAKEQGWNLDEVLGGMRVRASEWAKGDAPELFARMFRPKENGAPQLLPTSARIDEATGLPLNADGTVTVYHHTSVEKAAEIRRTGNLQSAAEPDVYVTNRAETDTGYGDTAVPIRVQPDQLRLDDEFQNGRKDFAINVGKPGGSLKVDVEQPSSATYREGAGTLNAGLNPEQVASAVRGIVKDAKDVTNGIIDSKAGQEVIGALFPMSTGSPKAQATAQRFANAMRLARNQWQRMSEFVRDNFKPEERRTMWDAADEENLIRSGTLAPAQGRGLDQLTPKQRDAVEHLHDLSQGLWKRAQAVGMVEGEGLPFWTPRMAVRIGADGDFLRPGGDGKTASSKGEGGNVKTSTPNTKQRKYTLAEETEAAMKARLGDDTELVRDIGVMPIAMSRMAQAIAGRELVNQLKEYGQAIDKPVISETGGPGFTTIDHPAFNTYRPEFITDATGKTVPRIDQNGDIVMMRKQMHISEDWAGPLSAVMSKTDGTIYSGYMLLKSKAMSAIMISPMTHNLVILGRALAYDPAAVLSLKAYRAGHVLARDPALINQAIVDGLVPIGANKGSMMDVTDLARSIGKDGGWLDPNESWINIGTQKVVNIFSEKAGTSVKAGMDAFGDWWHHTLLWKQVGALQTYIWNDYRNFMIEQGHPPEAAGPIAANLANRYAGAVAAENSSEMLRKTLNVMLFSRSFNVGNVSQAMHDTVLGLPAGMRAKMVEDAGQDAATAGIAAAASKARKGLIVDYAMAKIMTAGASAGVGYLLLNQTPDDIKNGYLRRMQAMVENAQKHPLTPDSYDPDRILPTHDNEVGKQERIDLGTQPGGRHEYMRLPTGKVVEDTIGWLLHAPTTFDKKLSPAVKGAWQAVTNDKGFGVPVEDPSGNVLKHIAQGVQHVIEAQVPLDTLKTLVTVMEGHGTELDKHKLIGFATGFSTSQGNPRGPEEAAFYAQQDRVKAEKAYAMEAVREDVKKGNTEAAYERLKAIGLPPREIVMTIQNIKDPRQGMSKQQARKFVLQANEEDSAALENARR